MSVLPFSQLKTQQRVDLVKAFPLPRPIRIFIEPGNWCNFKCVWCPESFEDYKDKAGGISVLQPSDFLLIASQIKELGKLSQIDFYMMGEPFANKNLCEYITLASKMELADKMMVSTNGTLVRPQIYDDIINSGLRYLRVSIYGANDTTQQQRTQSSFSLEKIKNNIRGLKARRDKLHQELPWIYVKMISCGPDEDAEFLREFEDVGDECAIEVAHNWKDDPQANLSGLPKEELLKQPHFANKKAVCASPFYSLIIHSDLRVGVCSADWSKSIVVGNVRDETLSEIWHGEKLREIQRLHVQRRRNEIPACANCTFLHLLPDNVDAIPESAVVTNIES